jgi:hypothetical protein
MKEIEDIQKFEVKVIRQEHFRILKQIREEKARGFEPRTILEGLEAYLTCATGFNFSEKD